MKTVNINGASTSVTDAEFAAQFPAPEPTPEPTPDERIAELETVVEQLTAIVEGMV